MLWSSTAETTNVQKMMSTKHSKMTRKSGEKILKASDQRLTKNKRNNLLDEKPLGTDGINSKMLKNIDRKEQLDKRGDETRTLPKCLEESRYAHIPQTQDKKHSTEHEGIVLSGIYRLDMARTIDKVQYNGIVYNMIKEPCQ